MARTSAVLNVSNLNGSNGFRITGGPEPYYAGSEVSGAGDINGDGYDDIIISQSTGFYGNVPQGAPFVVLGSASGFGSSLVLSSLNGTNGFRINGATSNGYVGPSASGAGDVNGDGIADFLVGSSFIAPAQQGRGTAYVVFGRTGGFGSSFDLSSLDGANGFRIDGVEGELTGYRVASAGDVNGDGFGDILVGTSGPTYVIFGHAGAFGSSLDLSSLNGADGFRVDGVLNARSISSAGDINGDGFADIVIGADGAGPGGRAYAGSTYVVFGRAGGFGSTLNVSSLDGTTGFRIDGAAARDASGVSVSSAGDINGDGIADLIVGARGADPGGRDGAGSSYVVFGRSGGFGSVLNLSSLDGSNGFRIDGTAAGDASGGAVSAAGDVNGDGFADLLVGARGTDPGGRTDAGSVYVVYGHSGGFGSSLDLSSLTGRNGFRIDGAMFNDGLGYAVSAAGDLNNDGLDDILVGAPNAQSGVSYVIYGARSTVPAAGDLNGDFTSDLVLQNGGSVVDWIMGNGRYQTGNALGTGAAGFTVVGRGDVNGDGTSDIVLQNGSTIVDWIIGGGTYRSAYTLSTGAAGYTVRAVGDLNANGTDDLVLQSGGSVVAWTLSGGAYAGGRVLGDAGGFTVVGAGDFDGDADADLLLQSGDTLVAWTLQDGAYQSGRTLPTIAGYRVAGTGDVNGDGTDDIVFQSLSGSGQVVDWIMGAGAFVQSNIVAGDAGGFSVRAVGDYNGDGTADVALQAGTGTVVQWSLRNGLYAGGTVIGNGGGFGVV